MVQDLITFEQALAVWIRYRITRLGGFSGKIQTRLRIFINLISDSWKVGGLIDMLDVMITPFTVATVSYNDTIFVSLDLRLFPDMSLLVTTGLWGQLEIVDFFLALNVH